jgi:flavin-dependent thymidylate synthase
MQISLIDFTGRGTQDERWYAARILAFTKNTRLQMTPDGFEKFAAMSAEQLHNELNYMSSSIASSWEFVDLTFAINGVSRACAQQITRTRTASYAMQSQRVTDMSTVTFHVPKTLKNPLAYSDAVQRSREEYRHLVDLGESLEDARGVLPISAHCNLLAKYNLRNWINVVSARDSLRVQGEYRNVIQAMKMTVLAAWPWVKTFLEPREAKAIALIEEVASGLPQETRIKLAKAADLLKKESA